MGLLGDVLGVGYQNDKQNRDEVGPESQDNSCDLIVEYRLRRVIFLEYRHAEYALFMRVSKSLEVWSKAQDNVQPRIEEGGIRWS